MDDAPDPDRFLVLQLRALLEVLPAALDRQVASFGLTSYEFALLETIYDSPPHRLRLTRLARSTSATLPRLSRVITALERKRYVERVRSEDDPRATDAVLTPAGRATVEAARPVMDLAVRRLILDPLTPDPRQSTALALRAILLALDPDGSLGVTTGAARSSSAS